MVPESRGHRLQAPVPAGKMFTPFKLQRGKWKSASIRCRQHAVTVFEDPVCFFQSYGIKKGWNHDGNARPFGGSGVFYLSNNGKKE
ncbi:MAG: hypothetical protein WBZ33_16620 [Thermoactinomyces sp.]